MAGKYIAVMRPLLQGDYPQQGVLPVSIILAKAVHLCFIGLLLLSSACTYRSAVDKPLTQWTPAMEQREGKQLTGERSSDLAVLLAFSGGGTRASAFAYGVLQELAATEVVTAQGARPLLHEVDMISSVSGGSFTAAYYGLYGEKIFTDFEHDFLRKDV